MMLLAYSSYQAELILIIIFTIASTTILDEGDEMTLSLILHARLRCAVFAYDQNIRSVIVTD